MPSGPNIKRWLEPQNPLCHQNLHLVWLEGFSTGNSLHESTSALNFGISMGREEGYSDLKCGKIWTTTTNCT